MNGILINGVFHEAIQSDTSSFKCDQCSLKDFCEEIGTSTLSYFPLCEHLTNDKLTVFVNRGSINIQTSNAHHVKLSVTATGDAITAISTTVKIAKDADVEIDLLIQNINIRVRPTSDIQDIIEIYRLKSK